MLANCALERTLSTGGACSARAANEFARASPGRRLRGAAQRGRQAALQVALTLKRHRFIMPL